MLLHYKHMNVGQISCVHGKFSYIIRKFIYLPPGHSLRKVAKPRLIKHRAPNILWKYVFVIFWENKPLITNESHVYRTKHRGFIIAHSFLYFKNKTWYEGKNGGNLTYM